MKIASGLTTNSAISKPSLATRRRGVTLIEVMIVIALLVLVAIILIPAIQSARGKARLQQCKNNLKQLGLALHNYHDVHATFPPGFVIAENGVYHGWGWGIMLTPYVDASPYYNTINFNPGLQSEFNKPHMNPIYQAYRCPADSGFDHVNHAFVVTTPVTQERVVPGTTDAVNTFARSNYFGVAGYLDDNVGGIKLDSSGDPTGSPPYINAGSLGKLGTSPRPGHRYCDPKMFRGFFGQNSRTRLKDITDGTSNTMMVGERYTPRDSGPNSVGHGTYLGVPDCTTAAGLAMSLGDVSLRLNVGIYQQAQTTAFGSNHGGGAHLLLGDGAVRFFANNIDIERYRNLATISGDPLESNF